MGKEQTATFIGHRECHGVQTEEVRMEIEKIIALGVTDFLNREVWVGLIGCVQGLSTT